MSNYVQTTFFAPKDALPPGNPSKTIFGAAYDVEFGNIATAITSKFDVTNLATTAQAQTGTSNSVLLTPSTYSSAAQASAGVYWNDTGAVNSLVITPVPAITAYVAGQTFRVKVGNTNTIQGILINVNGLGTKALTNKDGSVINQGQLRVGSIIEIVYDGGGFELQSGDNSFFGSVNFTGVGNTQTVNIAGAAVASAPLTVTGGTAFVATFQASAANSTQIGITGGNSGNQWRLTVDAQAASNFAIYDATAAVYKFVLTQGITAPLISGYGPVAAGLVDMTPDGGSFVGALTGFTAGVNVTCVWTRVGNLVILWFSGSGSTGTSNATTMTMTGLPAAIQAQRTQQCACTAIDNGTNQLAYAGVTNSGTITWSKGGPGGAWTNAGTKGMNNGVIAYLLN